MVMIGDRLTTDVMFGNINGMATIYVKPFECHHDMIPCSLKTLLAMERYMVGEIFEFKDPKVHKEFKTKL